MSRRTNTLMLQVLNVGGRLGFKERMAVLPHEALRIPTLRATGIEVRFTLLKEREMENAPQQIERQLQSGGSELNWPDASHILALRSV